MKIGQLAVKGARYDAGNNNNGKLNAAFGSFNDDINNKDNKDGVSKDHQNSYLINGASGSLKKILSLGNNNAVAINAPSSNIQELTHSTTMNEANNMIATNNRNLIQAQAIQAAFIDKYWLKPSPPVGMGDVVVIHVCDESRDLSKDFCCKRDILVNYMKYFDKFLTENENGYDDIDISVHCDIDIFEWLMSYIHFSSFSSSSQTFEPNNKPPNLDKSIVVSILISSEFLQMEPLVELCLEHISLSLNEIIKLPIDLSCISEKLINRLAFLTNPTILAGTKDRKDKILNKLYKRRVELDFSRKSGGKNGVRTIASALTCCRHCGNVYLDNYVSFLTCRRAPPTIDFRGQMTRQHYPLVAWSLTAYLKTLHAGNMAWEAIYWHVWAACVVFKVSNFMISALEVDRYTVEADALVIRRGFLGDDEENKEFALSGQGSGSNPSKLNFCLEAISGDENETFRMTVTPNSSVMNTTVTTDLAVGLITPSLNPNRPPDVLPAEIFSLLVSQMKFIAGLAHRKLIDSASETALAGAAGSGKAVDRVVPFDFYDVLWGDVDRLDGLAPEEETLRGRSPVRGRGDGGQLGAGRKQTHSLSVSKARVEVGHQAVLSTSSGGQDNNNSLGAGPLAADGSRRSRSTSSGAYNRNNNSYNNYNSNNGIFLSKIVPKPLYYDPSTIAKPIGRASSDDNTGENIEGSSSGSGLEGYVSVFRSMPTEICRNWMQSRAKGLQLGISLVQNPLELSPAAFTEALLAVQESAATLSAAKRLEWTLDVLREFDEKKMDRFESFLLSRRSPSLDFQFKHVNRLLKPLILQSISMSMAMANASGGSQMGNASQRRRSSLGGTDVDRDNKVLTKISGDYYKDRGRQPSRAAI